MSLHWRLVLLLWFSALLGWLLHAALVSWPLPQLLAWAGAEPLPTGWPALLLTLGVMLPLCLIAAAGALAPLKRLLRALEGAVLSYRDGDFSGSLAAQGRGELAQLTRLHKELGLALREQRQQLAQRELLLDSVVQNTPVALLLVDGKDQIAYANIAARQMLGEGRSLQGRILELLLAEAPAGLAEALHSGRDQLFTINEKDGEESFHVSQRLLSLQGLPHRLILLRRMTRELSRQEVASWKRVIRVISHELNNSLAPISSLAHSGAELARRGDLQRIPGVFASIGERARHLHSFLAGYASFAKLPAPRIEVVEWAGFVESLGAHCRFRVEGSLPVAAARFDAAQIEQALINLVKNAHEAGGDGDQVCLSIQAQGAAWRLCVADRGPGMSEAVLAQALLPFYSTKRSGTGLGLALAREIAEAHGGRIALANRAGGGLQVSLCLPR
ncbi:sensor histidine kinase [Paucibacter soli]|uniref:sensor histidine kinase n=1 Tax=Paucibacter soli TaxID=3133433 RepID=UPI0030AE8100